MRGNGCFCAALDYCTPPKRDAIEVAYCALDLVQLGSPFDCTISGDERSSGS